jgi:hypothetical protein
MLVVLSRGSYPAIDRHNAQRQSLAAYPSANLMAKMSASTNTAGLASANLPAISFASA